jgi:zinc/manganese transport system substrate-binding protein
MKASFTTTSLNDEWASRSLRVRSVCHSSFVIRHLITMMLLLVSVIAADAKLNIVATTPDLASIASVIGGDQVEITTLARPAEDPHFVDAKPSFIVKLNKAEALLQGGAELEAGWLSPLLAGARNPKIASSAPGNIRCNAGVQMLEVPTSLDRSKGDIHAAGNPHFMVDPENAKIVAQNICESFCKLDAGNCGTFRGNLKKFTDELNTKLEGWRKTLEPFKGAPVVAYHNSWPYFARCFGLKVELFLEPKPGIPPSPAHMADVIAKMKERKARVVFADPYLSRKTAETVANATGATVVNVTQYPGGVKGTEGGYIQMMDYLVNATAKALSEGK